MIVIKDKKDEIIKSVEKDKFPLTITVVNKGKKYKLVLTKDLKLVLN